MYNCKKKIWNPCCRPRKIENENNGRKLLKKKRLETQPTLNSWGILVVYAGSWWENEERGRKYIRRNGFAGVEMKREY